MQDNKNEKKTILIIDEQGASNPETKYLQKMEIYIHPTVTMYMKYCNIEEKRRQALAN